MKLWLLALLLVVPGVLASSDTVELEVGDSHEIEGMNVTLLGINIEEDNSILICVNGVKGIVSNTNSVNGVYVDAMKIREDYTKVKLEKTCIDCNEGDNEECIAEELDDVDELDDNDSDDDGDEELDDNNEIEDDSDNVIQKGEDTRSFTRWLYEWILSLFMS